jgi:translation initiation factor 1
MSEICAVCGLPKEICVCKELSKTEEKIRVYIERRKKGKYSTIIVGFDSSTDIKDLAKELKRKFACGGTAKNSRIELQGDHRNDIKGFLLARNYHEDQIDVR